MAYDKQTWVTGEVITEEKLNHMEDGIANNGGGVFDLDTIISQEGSTMSMSGSDVNDLIANMPSVIKTANLLPHGFVYLHITYEFYDEGSRTGGEWVSFYHNEGTIYFAIELGYTVTFDIDGSTIELTYDEQ